MSVLVRLLFAFFVLFPSLKKKEMAMRTGVREREKARCVFFVRFVAEERRESEGEEGRKEEIKHIVLFPHTLTVFL